MVNLIQGQNKIVSKIICRLIPITKLVTFGEIGLKNSGYRNKNKLTGFKHELSTMFFFSYTELQYNNKLMGVLISIVQKVWLSWRGKFWKNFCWWLTFFSQWESSEKCWSVNGVIRLSLVCWNWLSTDSHLSVLVIFGLLSLVILFEVWRYAGYSYSVYCE